MNTLFVPTISLDISLLDRLADSIDFSISKKVAFNNGKEDALEDFGNRHPDWIIIDSDTGNKGVADSWNECAKMFNGETGWLLCNDDCWFLPGQLETIWKHAMQYPNEPVLYLNSTQPYYCFVWNAYGKRVVGEFDANFAFAYYEDCDYRVRMRLMGITGHSYIMEGKPPVPHGKPRTGGMNYGAVLQSWGLLNRVYWRRKWGNQNFDEATYKTPYNDHRLTVDQWAWYPEDRAVRKRLWESFLALPNPSLYD